MVWNLTWPSGSWVQILGTQSVQSFSSSPKGKPTANWKQSSDMVSGKAASPQYKHFSSNWCYFKDLQVYFDRFWDCWKDLTIKGCFQLHRVFDSEKKKWCSGNKYKQVIWLVLEAKNSSSFQSLLTSKSLFLAFCRNPAGLTSLPESRALGVLESKDSDSHKQYT